MANHPSTTASTADKEPARVMAPAPTDPGQHEVDVEPIMPNDICPWYLAKMLPADHIYKLPGEQARAFAGIRDRLLAQAREQAKQPAPVANINDPDYLKQFQHPPDNPAA